MQATKLWAFFVDPPVVGFVVHARPWSDAAKRYVAFKQKVRLFANVAGVPEEIPKTHRATVTVLVAWKMKARIDLSNVVKAVEDGLFVRDRGIGEIRAQSHQHTGTEMLSVVVEFKEEGAERVQGAGTVHHS